jgi:L-lysine 6-transaminase
LIFDEVQTGFFGSGKAWLWQILGVAPDVVSFGKKTQVCGIYANRRVDEVKDTVFQRASRINSTWGGNLVDMVRCRQFIEIILAEKLHDNIAARGAQMVAGLRQIQKERSGFSNTRGLGSLVAFTLESPARRDEFKKKLYEKGVLSLSSGTHSIRFRLPLSISRDEIDTALERVEDCALALV